MGIDIQNENIILSNKDVRRMMWIIFSTSTLVTVLLLILTPDHSSGNFLVSIIDEISLNFEILLIPLIPLVTGMYLYLIKERMIELNRLGITFSILRGEKNIVISWNEINTLELDVVMVRFKTSRFNKEITISPGNFVMTTDNRKIEKYTTTIADYIQTSMTSN